MNNILIKTTWYGNICVSYYSSLKLLSTIKDNTYLKKQYMFYNTKDALKDFRNYIKERKQ